MLITSDYNILIYEYIVKVTLYVLMTEIKLFQSGCRLICNNNHIYGENFTELKYILSKENLYATLNVTGAFFHTLVADMYYDNYFEFGPNFFASI